jgi:osmotically-inducible protein OsmY
MADPLDDAGITASVKTALAADPAPSAYKIDVSRHGGEVMPTGPAPDAKDSERAAVLAAAPHAVRSVDNRLVVAPMPSSSAASVASTDRS